jgi:hypothetical protein
VSQPYDGHRVRGAERITVTRITALEGIGQDASPLREVEYWYDDDGRLIARRDGWREHQDAEPELVS